MSDSKDSNVFDEAEIRSEVLRTISMGDERRTGDSDRLTVGRVSAVDLVEGHEDATIHGSLREVVDNHRMSLVDRVDYEIKGKLSSKTHSESFMVGGNVVETFAGATLLLAGMSDDMVVGGGSRITAPLDVTMAGLIGMEEKIGSGFIDGVFSEFSAVGINREFGPGVHNCGSVTYEGHILTTQATGMMPLMQTWTGVRNLTLGSHFNQEGTKKARSGLSFGPPPVPPKPPSGVGALARTAAGGGRVQDIEQLSDAARRMDDVAEMATAAEDSRAASNGAQAEVLAELRHGEHFVDATVTADDGTSTTVRLASDLDPNDLDDDELYNLEMTKRLDEMQSQSDQFMTELRQRVQQNLPVDDDPPPIPGRDPTGAQNAGESGAQNAGAGSSVKKKVQWVDGGGIPTNFTDDGVPGGTYPGPGLEYNDPAKDGLANWEVWGVDSTKYIFASETDAATDQANAVEEMRRIHGDLLEMDWLKDQIVTADPVADEDMYKSQLADFEKIKADYRKLYDADPKNQTFAAMYRNAAILNQDLFKTDRGMSSAEATKLKDKRQDVALALRAFQEDYVASLEEYIRAASRPPPGKAPAAESMNKTIVVTALDGTANEVTFQEIVDSSLNRTMEYLEYLQAYGKDPYIDDLPPEAVGNGDAYDMLRGLLGTSDQDAKYNASVERYEDLKASIPGQQKKVEKKQLEVNAYQRQVDDLKLRIEALEEQKRNTGRFQRGKRRTLEAEIQRLTEDLATAQSNLETQQEMWENANNSLIKKQRDLKGYGNNPYDKIKKDQWGDKQQRIEFILDTLQQVQDDIDEGIDPGARLRTQADYYHDLGGLYVVDRSSPRGGQDGKGDLLGLQPAGVLDKDSRKWGGRPITFEERSYLTKLVLDNLDDLGLKYDIGDAFATKVPYDFDELNMLFNMIGAETRPDTLAAMQDSVREAQRLAEAKALAEAASTLADNPPPVRIDAALDPAAGLSHPPGQGAYDFSTGTADNLVDMTRIEAEAAADAPPPSTLDTVPLNQVEAEDPPRQMDGDNIYDDTVNPDNVYENADDYEPDFSNWTLPMTDDGDNYQQPRDLGRWGTERGPVVSEDGGSSWKTAESGSPTAPTRQKKKLQRTTGTGATGGSAAPTPSPRTRNPSPPPMEDVEWRGVQAAVPETPTDSKPVPKPRTRGPSPTPVETTPLPDGSNKMFGPTAGDQSATVSLDDAALPTGQIDNDWSVGEDYGNASQYTQANKTVDDTTGDDLHMTLDEARKKMREWQNQNAGGSAGRPLNDGTVGQDNVPWKDATAEGLTVMMGRTRRKEDGREYGFGFAKATNKVLDYDPGVAPANRFELSENRMIFRAFDVAADEATLDGVEVTANTKKAVDTNINYVTLEWIQDQIKLNDAAGGVPEQRLSARNRQILPSSLDERMQKRLELVESVEDLRNSDKAFLDDLADGVNGGLGGEQLRVNVSLNQHGDSDAEKIMGYREAYAKMATKWKKKGYTEEAATYQRYVDIIDEYNKSRFTKLLEVTDFRNNAQLPDVYRAKWFMDGGDGGDASVDLGDTLGASIREKTSKWMDSKNLSASDISRAYDAATDGTPDKFGRPTVMMNDNVGRPSPKDPLPLFRQRGIAAGNEWDQMLRQNKILQDPNTRQAQTVAALDQAARDAENYINPLARIDLEIAYLESLKSKDPVVQTRLQALKEAKTIVIDADDWNAKYAELLYADRLKDIDDVFTGGKTPKFKHKAQYNWKLTPIKKQEFLAGNTAWSEVTQHAPNLVGGAQPVFGGPPPALPPRAPVVPPRPPGGWVI